MTGWFPSSVAVAKPLTRPGDSVDYDGDDENSRALERDRRAVASPQGSHRSRQIVPQEQHERVVQELEASLSQERELTKKYAEDVRRLEAENSRVRTERDAEKQEREREVREQREHHEAERAKQERRTLEDRVRLEREMAGLQEEMTRKDAQLALLSHHTTVSQASFKQCPMEAPKRELSRPTETSVMSEKSMAFPGTPQGSASYPVAAGPGSAPREDSIGLHSRPVIGRQASDSITRQLFTQQTLSEHPAPLSARGMNRHTSEPLQALQSLTTSSA